MSASGKRGAGFGLDAELARKQAAKFDPAREAACLQWVEAVTQEKLGDSQIGPALKNGQALVKLVNKIQAGSVKKVETSSMPFKQMENISNFLRACRSLGVEEHELFETVDLFEEKDLTVVVDCLFSLSRTAQKKIPSFPGPYIAAASSNPRTQVSLTTTTTTTAPSATVFQVTQSAQSLSLESVESKAHTSTLSSAKLGKLDSDSSSKSTISSGQTQLPPPKPVKPIASSSANKTSTTTTTGTTAASTTASTISTPSSSGSSVTPVGRGGGYGLDADLAKKQAEKYDKNSEKDAITWIEAVLGLNPLVPQGETFASALKSGEVLCNLVNAIKPNSVQRVNNSKMPFKQMENITSFLKACRALGVLEHDLFETVDLYEEKDMNTVVLCIFALGRTVQVTVPEYTGPALGPRMAQENKRSFTADQLLQARRDSGVTKQTAGSQATMERSHISTAGSVTFGADKSGQARRESGGTKQTAGSQATMERSHVSTANNITFGADISKKT